MPGLRFSAATGLRRPAGRHHPCAADVRKQHADGASTQIIYVVVNSADALYTQAKAAGAEIVVELKDEDYGGRGFSCRDLEGHLWSFGTYDPWAEPAESASTTEELR